VSTRNIVTSSGGTAINLTNEHFIAHIDFNDSGVTLVGGDIDTAPDLINSYDAVHVSNNRADVGTVNGRSTMQVAFFTKPGLRMSMSIVGGVKTIVVACQLTAFQTLNGFLNAGSTFGGANSTGWYAEVEGVAPNEAQVAYDTDPHVFWMEIDGNDSKLYIDDTLTYTYTGAASSITVNNPYIAWWSGTGYEWNGHIMDVFMGTGLETAEYRAQLTSTLLSQMGV